MCSQQHYIQKPSIGNRPKCQSVDEWIVYIMEYYTAEIKESLPFATAVMELDSIMLSEINQLVKDKYRMISLVRGV